MLLMRKREAEVLRAMQVRQESTHGLARTRGKEGGRDAMVLIVGQEQGNAT